MYAIQLSENKTHSPIRAQIHDVKTDHCKETFFQLHLTLTTAGIA